MPKFSTIFVVLNRMGGRPPPLPPPPPTAMAVHYSAEQTDHFVCEKFLLLAKFLFAILYYFVFHLARSIRQLLQHPHPEANFLAPAGSAAIPVPLRSCVTVEVHSPVIPQIRATLLHHSQSRCTFFRCCLERASSQSFRLAQRAF